MEILKGKLDVGQVEILFWLCKLSMNLKLKYSFKKSNQLTFLAFL